jgi:DNA-binding protein YbaB
MIRVLAFRGDVVSAKVKGQEIIIEIAINPKWENEDKVNYLKEWIPAKVRKVFEVISVSEK